MSEETKKPEENKPEEAKEQKPAEKQAPKETATSEPKDAQAGKKKKKINSLNLKELEKKIQEVQEKMGNLDSFYAQQLLKQKNELMQADMPKQEAKEDNGS